MAADPWGAAWPVIRQESHYGDRVVPCFAERPKSLHALLDDAVKSNGAGDALVCGDRRLTYRDLHDQSGRLAGALAARGIAAGDRVALLVGNRPEFVVAVFATARLGAIVVPLSVREATPGITYMLNQCTAAALIHDAELADRLPATAETSALRLRISIGKAPGAAEWSAVLTSGITPEPAAVREEDTAAILYTSGTTGRPKGAMLTHLGIVHSSMHFQIAMKLGPADCSIAAVPLSHVTGLIALITTMVRAAAKLVIMPAFKADEFLRIAGREGLTHSLMVPAMYNLCLLQPDFERVSLPGWRIGAYGGAPMPVATIAALAAKVPALMLMNCYGSTETTSPATLMPVGQTAAHNDTVGIALPCAELRVMDDDGRELRRGELGELWIRGPMVVRGYWDDPEASASNFTAGFWHSGDLGSIDGDGYVKVVDRKKDMINRGGYKIYTIEVENALYLHPAVQECAVVARPCPVLGERVHAFVMLKSADGADAQALKAWCLPRLADYKVPETFTLSTTPLPRNANGKLIKRALRDEVRAQTAAAGEERG